MLATNFLYVVCFFGIPVAVFKDGRAAEQWRVRNFLSVAYKNDTLVRLMSFRQAPESSVIRVQYDRKADGFIFSDSVCCMRYSRNATDQASLGFSEDLPE